MPDADYIAISRKIDLEAERQRLKQLAEGNLFLVKVLLFEQALLVKAKKPFVMICKIYEMYGAAILSENGRGTCACAAISGS